MQMRLIKHTMVTSFDVSLTSPEKGSSVVFIFRESRKNIKGDSIGVPFSKIV
jgi:hypothetical protein